MQQKQNVLLLGMDKSFYKSVLAIALPVSMQGLISAGVNMMDTAMLGLLGETALSASSLANQFIGIFQILCTGIGMGSAVMTARFWGAKDVAAAKKVVTIMYRLALGLVAVFTGITLAAPGGIMRLYTADEAVIGAGMQYFMWSLPAYLLSAFSLATTAALRTIGQVRIPLYSSILSFFANVFFNWMFIFGKLGAPRMGVAGAALGTTLSRVAEFGIICGYFLFKEKSFGYRLSDLKIPCKDYLKDYLHICLPVLISDAMLALGNNLISMIMGRIGTEFVSANAITSVTVHLATVFVMGVSNASGVITGNTLGAGDRERAQRGGTAFFVIGAAIGLVGGVFVVIMGGYSLSLYNIGDTTVDIARQLMLAVAITTVFQSANSILTKGVLRAGGDTRFLMVIDALLFWVLALPLGYFAGLVWKLSPFLIHICLRSDHIVKAIVCVFRLKSGKWIKRLSTAERSM